MPSKGTRIYTIGHSSMSSGSFIMTLRAVGVTLVADVRSHPYSRAFPEFGRERLRADLEASQLSYMFLGDELGGRPQDPTCYDQEGRVDYEKVKEKEFFRRGIEILCEKGSAETVCVMCVEKDPLKCHRGILIARQLTMEGVEVLHVVDDKRLVAHRTLEDRIVLARSRGTGNLFSSREEELNEAYASWGRKIAYKRVEQDD